jgi:hypothetical protein
MHSAGVASRLPYSPRHHGICWPVELSSLNECAPCGFEVLEGHSSLDWHPIGQTDHWKILFVSDYDRTKARQNWAEEGTMDWAGLLRAQLQARALIWSQHPGVESYRSLGDPPTVLFRQSKELDYHGNFFQDAWAEIKAHPEWYRRLEKRHTQSAALPPEHRASAKELDSSNSSDALLMNCFCYPGASKRLAGVLGHLPLDAVPQFGFRAGILLSGGSADTTEVDMLLGDTLVEAKLTERDFTSRPTAQVCRYSALREIFDVNLLPAEEGHFRGYQLIRNVLAAAQHQMRLVVLLDVHRPDLLEQWWQVHAAISSSALRCRCGVRFWQQLAAAAEPQHRDLLAEKYGV